MTEALLCAGHSDDSDDIFPQLVRNAAVVSSLMRFLPSLGAVGGTSAGVVMGAMICSALVVGDAVVVRAALVTGAVLTFSTSFGMFKYFQSLFLYSSKKLLKVQLLVYTLHSLPRTELLHS